MGGQKNRMDKTQKKQELLERSNQIIFIFTVIYYLFLLAAVLIQQLLVQGSPWSFAFFWGVAVALFCQIISFFSLKDDMGYGKLTLLIASLVFTWANCVHSGSEILLLYIPITIMCAMYLHGLFVVTMYSIWMINALIKLGAMIFYYDTPINEYQNFIWIVFICSLYGLALSMLYRVMRNGYEVVLCELTRENRMHLKMYEKSTKDTTTELMNRNAYNEYLKSFNAREKQSVCCIYIDVNGLHEYNNTYGHHEGDKMLNAVADELKRCFAGEQHYRIGGDEFVVICENASFQKILQELKQFRVSMKAHRIHVATGVEWRDDDININEMIKVADSKMYQDKERFYESLRTDKENVILYERAVE